MLLLILKRVRTTTLVTLRKKEVTKIRSLMNPKPHLRKKENTVTDLPKAQETINWTAKTKVNKEILLKNQKAQAKTKARSSKAKVKKLRQSQLLHLLSLLKNRPPLKERIPPQAKVNLKRPLKKKLKFLSPTKKVSTNTSVITTKPRFSLAPSSRDSCAAARLLRSLLTSSSPLC